MIPAAGTRWQRAAGIADTPQRFHDDIMRKTGNLLRSMPTFPLRRSTPIPRRPLTDTEWAALSAILHSSAQHAAYGSPDPQGQSRGGLFGFVIASTRCSMRARGGRKRRCWTIS